MLLEEDNRLLSAIEYRGRDQNDMPDSEILARAHALADRLTAVDGFALAASGNIYLALVGPGANQLVQISPTGKELARVPGSPDANAQMEVPFDSPSSVEFDGERMIVTNDAYFSGVGFVGGFWDWAPRSCRMVRARLRWRRRSWRAR